MSWQNIGDALVGKAMYDQILHHSRRLGLAPQTLVMRALRLGLSRLDSQEKARGKLACKRASCPTEVPS